MLFSLIRFLAHDSIIPEVLKSMRGHRGVAHRVLNVPMPQIILNGSGIMPTRRQVIAAYVPPAPWRPPRPGEDSLASMSPVSFSGAAQRARGIETLPKTNVGEAAMTSIDPLKPHKCPCNTLPKTLSSRQNFLPPTHPLRV